MATDAHMPSSNIAAFRWPVFFRFFAVTAALLSFQHRDFYFRRPVVAFGDFSANALAIRNAGELRELHGNYSRWHFDHPGPFVFYVEAAGERVFYRWLKVCPGSHNAHAYAGMLLQVAFWSSALTILAGYLPSAIHLWLIWLVGWIHFYATAQAFVSTWPPHVLLMPFLCFSIACASVATGRVTHLWLLVPTGLVLVHMHVAQPLSVMVLGGGTLVGLGILRWRHEPWEFPHGRQFWVWLALCTVPAALLLLPLVLDLFLGPESNARAIISFLVQHKGDTKSPTQSIHYFLEFARYWGYHDVPAVQFLGEFRTQPLPLVFWGLLALLGLWHCTAQVFQTGDIARPVYERFLLRLAVVFFLAAICAYYWGTRMDGEMYAFNGFYFYSIYFLLLLLAGCAITERIITRFRFLPAITRLCAVGLPVILPAHRILSDVPNGNALLQTVEPLLQYGTLSISRPIMLLCTADRWSEATALVNILEERGARFAVPRSWQFLFGRRFALDRPPPSAGRPVLWDVVSEGSIPQERSINLGGGARLVEVSTTIAPDRGPWETRFDQAFLTLTAGFVADGPYPPWSVGSEGDIILPVVASQTDVEISLDVHALAGPANSAPRRLVIEIAGQPATEFSVTGQQTLRLLIPRDVWNTHAQRWGFLPMHLRFLDPISPQECGVNDDRRALSIAFQRLRIEAANTRQP